VAFPLRGDGICSRAIDITISSNRIMHAAVRLQNIQRTEMRRADYLKRLWRWGCIA
jgi:hypothetical protein